MAIKGQIPVEFGAVFPDGAYAAGGFEKVRDATGPPASGRSSRPTRTAGCRCGSSR